MEEITENNESNDSDFILSMCWDCGYLSAVYYNVETMELHIMNETGDLRPDYIQLRNLFRQVQPSYMVTSGPNNFLEDIIKLLDLPEGTDYNKFKIKKSKSAIANNVAIYPFNRRNNLSGFRKQIYELNLPGLPSECSRSDRKMFIDSVFPMDQDLMVHSLGNLLQYLNDNYNKWRQVFLNFDKKPIITNLNVFYMESQVLMDDSTFNALNIFSNITHPSSFKNQIRKDGLSLFNLLNQCCSSIGVQELKSMLKQPTRDVLELNLRFTTIEWCMDPKNFEHVVKLRSYLKNLLNINAIVRRIIVNYGKTSDWKSLKKTVYHSFLICEFCGQFDPETIKATFLHDIAKFVKDELTIKGILYALDKIVDLEKIDLKKRFIVKEGLDAALDAKRNNLKEMIHDTGMEIDVCLNNVNATENAFNFVHFTEMGFVIGSDLKIDEMNLTTIKDNGIELILQTNNAVYFRSPNTKKLNDQYAEKLADIIGHEMRIFSRLITFINENMAELIEISKICAKLDCLVSMSSVSMTNKFIKPIITTEKTIEIVNGRHPLVEQIREFTPSTTMINEDKQNYINIINAPNASGKSVYMKQVALICFMAHIGCFVPADSCRINLLHSIYTRIYSPESVYQGQSAFMADLQQMSKVVMNSTNRSLILIDEFGKGTHFKDGMALLASSIEHFIERGPLTPIAFISTHYYHTISLLKSTHMINLQTIATQKNAAGVFQSLYQIKDGANEQNYFTEFPESKKIISNIFGKKNKDKDYENFTEANNIAIKSFVMILVKMQMKANTVKYEFINDLYTKVDLENFLNSPNSTLI